jgi:hypothetical protein
MHSERFGSRPTVRPMRVIAVTGTSGKTTTTWLSAAALAEAGHRVGVLSDLGCLAPGDPEPVASAYGSRFGLAAWLGRLAEAGCSHAVVEVSTAMLADDLLSDIQLDTLVVTNHATGRLAARGARAAAGVPATAVAALRPGGVLVTGCDPAARARLAQRLPAGCHMVTAGLADDCDVRATPVEGHLFGRTVLVSAGGQVAALALATPVVSFVRDSLLAAAVGDRHGIPLDVAVRGIESAGGVPGRVERLDRGQDAALFIDSPTTGHALAATLASLRRLTKGRLVVIAEEPLVKRIGGGRFGPLVARHCGTDHHVIELSPAAVLHHLDDSVGLLGDPIGDPLTVPNALLFHMAAATSGVMLNGEGGDPCFGGPKNLPMLLAELYGDPSADALARERAYLRAHLKCFDDLPGMLAPDVHAALAERPLESELTAALADPRWRTFIGRLQAVNVSFKGGHHILPKVDALSEPAGILPRSPLFDREVVECAFAIPPQHKLKGSVEKHLLKRAVADLLPATIIDRPKSGMLVPVEAWFQGPLLPQAKERLLDGLAPRGIVNRGYLERLLAGRLGGLRPRHGAKIWLLVTLEAWLRRVFDRSRPL